MKDTKALLEELESTEVDLSCLSMRLQDIREELAALRKEIIEQENAKPLKDALEILGMQK